MEVENKDETINSEIFYNGYPINENGTNQSHHAIQNTSLSELNRESKNHIICKKCNTVPSLGFISYNKVHYKCNCYESTQTIDKLLDINIFDENKNNYRRNNNDNDNISSQNDESSNAQKQIKEAKEEDKYKQISVKCKAHIQEFAYYCKECKLNLCRECLKQSEEHKNHELFIFDVNYFEINKIIKDNNEYIKVKESDSKEIKNFKKLMIIIFDDFKNFTNYFHFSTIKSFHNFLQKKGREQNSDINSEEKKNYIYIRNKKELDDNFNNANNIRKINIEKSDQNIISFVKILGPDLINLIELELKESNIISIESLANNKFENLQSLNLACNQIDDSNIKYFFQLDFPKLENLNLYDNKLTNPELLKLKNDTKKLPNLNLFFIGNNKFKFCDNNLNDKYNFASVLEIGISRNFFNQNSIKYIKCFTFTNLEIIYLSYNHLENFDFINDLELPAIKEFWVNYNYLTTYEPLVKYKTLEVIEIKNNKIKADDLENIEDFIRNFKGLKRFNLEGNDISDLLNNLTIEKIKKLYKVSIIYNS